LILNSEKSKVIVFERGRRCSGGNDSGITANVEEMKEMRHL